MRIVFSGLSGNFPVHHVVHGYHHSHLYHHGHHIHHYGGDNDRGHSKILEFSPGSAKFNMIYGRRIPKNAAPSGEKLEFDEDLNLSPKVRFSTKQPTITDSPKTRQRYGKSPISSSASMYQISVNGRRRQNGGVDLIDFQVKAMHYCINSQLNFVFTNRNLILGSHHKYFQQCAK